MRKIEKNFPTIFMKDSIFSWHSRSRQTFIAVWHENNKYIFISVVFSSTYLNMPRPKSVLVIHGKEIKIKQNNPKLIPTSEVTIIMVNRYNFEVEKLIIYTSKIRLFYYNIGFL